MSVWEACADLCGCCCLMPLVLAGCQRVRLVLVLVLNGLCRPAADVSVRGLMPACEAGAGCWLVPSVFGVLA